MDGTGWGPALRASRTARGLSLRGLQRLVSYDFTYLGQVERGEKPGSYELAQRCDEVLEASGALLRAYSDRTALAPVGGALATPSAGTVAPRPDGSAGCEPACAAAAADRLRDGHCPTCPLDRLPAALPRLSAENGAALRRAVPGEQRDRLLEDRADLALLQGRSALFGRWDPVAARGWFTLAREVAGETGSPARAASVDAHLAVVAARAHAPAAARDYLSSARLHADRSGVPLLSAWLAPQSVTDAVEAIGRPASEQVLARAGVRLERPCTARPGRRPAGPAGPGGSPSGGVRTGTDGAGRRATGGARCS